MIVVVNTRLFIPDRLDGIGRFAYETLSRITRTHSDVEFVFLFDRKISDDFIFSENITPVKLLPPARRPFLFRLWLNWSVAGVLRDLNPDLFLSPDGMLPLRTETPCLPVIHDLNFEHYPQDLPKNIARFYKTDFPKYAQKATRIATVSEFSKNDIHQHYQIALDNIDVVYNGASTGFLPLTPTQIQEVRKQYTQDAPYFLFVGSLHPRKNLARLIAAFGKFKAAQPSRTKLLVVGQPYWTGFDLDHILNSMPAGKEDVIFTGRVSQQELQRITAAALALTYVPYFEGFGIPIVEAMACHVPVITSNITSMPEVAGDAALLVDPFSEESIAAAMRQLDTNESSRLHLIDRGRIQLQKFSWEKSATLLWESMEKTMKQKKALVLENALPYETVTKQHF
ncbi:MAG: glycosyltransferase family 4 protein [Bacteroidia bacterium]